VEKRSTIREAHECQKEVKPFNCIDELEFGSEEFKQCQSVETEVIGLLYQPPTQIYECMVYKMHE